MLTRSVDKRFIHLIVGPDCPGNGGVSYPQGCERSTNLMQMPRFNVLDQVINRIVVRGTDTNLVSQTYYITIQVFDLGHTSCLNILQHTINVSSCSPCQADYGLF